MVGTTRVIMPRPMSHPLPRGSEARSHRDRTPPAPRREEEEDVRHGLPAPSPSEKRLLARVHGLRGTGGRRRAAGARRGCVAATQDGAWPRHRRGAARPTTGAPCTRLWIESASVRPPDQGGDPSGRVGPSRAPARRIRAPRMRPPRQHADGAESHAAGGRGRCRLETSATGVTAATAPARGPFPPHPRRPRGARRAAHRSARR